MKNYSENNVKNIAFLGHGGSGKTTLADSVLYYKGAADRIGKTDEGTALMDFDPEEKKRGVSVSTSCFALEDKENKINIIDAPGQFDFAGGVCEALAAADSVVITVSGKSGLTVGARSCYKRAKAQNKSIAFFVGKLDSVHAHFYRVISSLVANYGAAVCPVVVPYIEDESVKCYVDMINSEAYSYDGFEKTVFRMPESKEISQMRDMFLESVASVDEELLEKYLNGEQFTKEEIIAGLKKGIKSGDICPVFSGVQQRGDAIAQFAEALFEIMPTALEEGFSSSGETKLLVFKTIADPFVGKLSYFKVISGTVKPDSKLKIARTGDEERFAKIMILKGAKQEEVSSLCAGDIGCAAKLGFALTGDVLSEKGNDEAIEMNFPLPNLSLAVYPKNKGEEDKVAAGLSRLAEEDPTVLLRTDGETHEQILSALGEQHLDVIISRLKSKFGVDAELRKPKIAYRETIKKSVKAQGRHKKQSGGHGQFGDVWIEFEPCDSHELVFEEKVFGGSVPKNFFPAVEKGLRESMANGVLAGYPMVGIKATLYDGSYHPVDSSEMAFKTAAALAFKEGVSKANPVLMEPIGTLTVTVPDEMLGDVISDINKRRGRIIGMNPAPDKMQEVIGEVPMAQMQDFATAMRSITQGTASFTLEFSRYEEVPSNIAEEIIKNKK